jgi:hypothetical protein
MIHARKGRIREGAEMKNEIHRIEIASAGIGLLLIFALALPVHPGASSLKRAGGPAGKPSATAAVKRVCKSGSWLGRSVPRSPERCANPRRLQVDG